MDLATCRTAKGSAAASRQNRIVQGSFTATVRATGKGKTAKQTIWVTDERTKRSHPVFSETEYYTVTGPGETPGPIVLLGWSGDAKWIFFMIDSGSSASIMADGLTLHVVSAQGGSPHRIARMLAYADYMTWCGSRLVFSAGFDRVAVHDKHLDVAAPPEWKPRPLVRSRLSFGSVACMADRASVVVQAQANSEDANFFHTHWSLYRVGLNGSITRLTHPPAGYADESPKVTANAVYFVRSRKGYGELYALENSALVGPLLPFGYSLGYYGHQAWPYSVRR